MKNISTIVFAVILLTSCTVSKKNGYTATQDGDDKVLVGKINRELIEADTSFPWFKTNMKYGTADANAVKVFSEKKDNFSMVVFGGTWCHDTQNLLPVFYKLIDKSGYHASKITLIGVDKKKQTISNLHKKYNIVNVPTFIIFNNKMEEVGRVVEYGKLGQIDKELGQLVQQKIQ